MSRETKGIYRLKPVNTPPEQIPLPEVMYKLPKIQGGPIAQLSDNITADIKTTHPEYNILETRQMKILQQLCELKEQFESFCCSVRLSDTSKVPATGTCTQQEPVLAELILHANPSSPPCSILALQRIWKDTRFNLQIHKHSSVSNIETGTFEQKLLSNANSNAIHIIDLKLIWKDVEDIKFITKVHDYPLEGEANVLRYLSRLIGSYKYEDSKTLEPNLIDSVLDLCLRLSYEELRNVDATISKFATYLSENSWFFKSPEATAVDAIVWSTIKRVAHYRLPRELKCWYELCENLFLSA